VSVMKEREINNDVALEKDFSVNDRVFINKLLDSTGFIDVVSLIQERSNAYTKLTQIMAGTLISRQSLWLDEYPLLWLPTRKFILGAFPEYRFIGTSDGFFRFVRFLSEFMTSITSVISATIIISSSRLYTCSHQIFLLVRIGRAMDNICCSGAHQRHNSHNVLNRHSHALLRYPD
jgi:hypothetical protein